MNNIQEKDWAEDDGWGCHSGMRSNPYGEPGDGGSASVNAAEAGADLPGGGMTQHHPEQQKNL